MILCPLRSSSLLIARVTLLPSPTIPWFSGVGGVAYILQAISLLSPAAPAHIALLPHGLPGFFSPHTIPLSFHKAPSHNVVTERAFAENSDLLRRLIIQNQPNEQMKTNVLRVNLSTPCFWTPHIFSFLPPKSQNLKLQPLDHHKWKPNPFSFIKF